MLYFSCSCCFSYSFS